MSSRSAALFLLLLSLVSLSSLLVSGAERGACVGCAQPIEVDHEDVVAAARFAVGELQGNTEIEFKVLEAERQVVAGFNYFLTVEIRENEYLKTVKCVIFEPLGTRKMFRLSSFEVLEYKPLQEMP